MSYFTPKNVARVLNFGQKASRVWNSPGARTVRAVAKSYRTRVATNRARQTRSKGFGGASSAMYVGPFKRPTRAKTTKVSQYLSQGVMETKEIYGDINDPDCVYLTFSTFDRDMIINVIMATLFKKLLRKAGINIDSYNQEIPVANFNNSLGLKLQSVFKDAAGTYLVNDHLTVDNENIEYWQASDVVKIRAWFLTVVQGTPTTPFTTEDWQLERLCLYSNTQLSPGVNETRILAELNVMQEILQIESMCEIAIQNRTKGGIAGTGDTETDRVDSQPLQGKLYELSGGVPKERQKDYTAINTVAMTNGVGLQQAGTLGTTYKEPPPAKHFSNITKCSGQVLQPGTIKKHYLKWYARGFVNNLMSKWRVILQAGTIPSSQVGAPGKCALFALEEVMNSGSTNKITVNYEVDRKVMAKLVTSKPAPMKPKFSETNFSKITV